MLLRRLGNKRGQIMGVFILFITLVFCAIVLMLYVQDRSKLDVSIVSPDLVLEMGDSAALFALEEESVLRDVYCSDLDVALAYCERFSSLPHSSFLTDGTIPEVLGITSDNFCEKVYTFNADGVNVEVSRKGLLKRATLRSGEGGVDEIRFDVGFRYNLDAKYLLTPEVCV
ncbi:MAG: hypothetical protein ACI83O_000461 [Patescibacteria group bacterium]|jgi:hypothetical protein